MDFGLPVFLVGDFNAAVGHESYNLLTAPKPPYGNGGFKDAWQVCKTHSKLVNNISTSFHAYFGLLLENWYCNSLLFAAMTWHGNYTMPQWGRYHIDWILYKEYTLRPVVPLAAILAVANRQSKYPSDHYPLVAIFRI